MIPTARRAARMSGIVLCKSFSPLGNLAPLDPACGCRTAIFRAGVESDGRLWRGTMDGVDHRFKNNQPTGWQAQTRANHHTIVDVIGQAAFNGGDRSLIGVDEAVLAMPAARFEIGEHEFDSRVDLLCRPVRRQRRIRKVHRRRIKTDQPAAFHRPSTHHNLDSPPKRRSGERPATSTSSRLYVLVVSTVLISLAQ